MCSGPEEGEEVGQVKALRQEGSRGGGRGKGQANRPSGGFSDPKAEDTASPPKCQLWSLSGDCPELPQAALLTPPQEAEMDSPDVDTHGPGTRANPGPDKSL